MNMDIRKLCYEGMNWIKLAQDRVQLRICVMAVTHEFHNYVKLVDV
jgi:hypothetical protein